MTLVQCTVIYVSERFASTRPLPPYFPLPSPLPACLLPSLPSFLSPLFVTIYLPSLLPSSPIYPADSGGVKGPSSLPTDMADFELPSYDDVVEDDEPVIDENERIARQEEEDARIAKELFEKEKQSRLAEVSCN